MRNGNAVGLPVILIGRDDALQIAHVMMVIGKKMPVNLNPNTIYYQVCEMPKTYSKITELADWLTSQGFIVEKFYEPDIKKTVAIGIHPVISTKRKGLTEYELLKL